MHWRRRRVRLRTTALTGLPNCEATEEMMHYLQQKFEQKEFKERHGRFLIVKEFRPSEDKTVPPLLFIAFRIDRESFCGEIPAGEGMEYKQDEKMAPQCLQMLSEQAGLMGRDYKDHRCQHEMMTHRQMMVQEFLMSPEIVMGCAQQIDKYCSPQGDIESNGKSAHCLMAHSQEKDEEKLKFFTAFVDQQLNDACGQEVVTVDNWHKSANKLRGQDDKVAADPGPQGDIEPEGKTVHSLMAHEQEEDVKKWWDNEQNKYVQPNLKYQPFDFKCLNEFHWHAYGPACGDPFYEFAKHCAMVKFYENKSPKKWIAENNPDSLLVLIDGCVVCDEEGSSGTLANPKDQQIEATIRLQHIWPAGSFFTSCNEANHTAGELHLKLGNATVDISEMNIDSSTSEEGVRTLMESGRYHYASFSLAAVLFQRQCSGLFSHDPVPEMYQNLTLIVEHNCKGAKATKEIQIQLRDLSYKQFKDNWAELRGLYINLMNPMDTRQYSYVEFKYIDLAENLEGIQWFNMVETEDDGF